MTIQEEFNKILEKNKEDKIIPFLKELSSEERSELAPLVKKQVKYYGEFLQEGNTWRSRQTPEQHRILQAAGFVCFEYKNIKSLEGRFEIEVLDKVLKFHTPKWLGKYYDALFKREWMPSEVTYLWTMKKMESGLINPSEEFIAHRLCEVIYDDLPKYKKAFKPEAALIYPITLEEHFWYFFKYEVNVNYAGRWFQFEEDTNKVNANWHNAIIQFCKENKLPRDRVLKESLKATTLNVNRNLIYWYIDLFLVLEPTKAEQLDLQDYLFQTFNSPQSKPINIVLKLCKKLVLEDKFNTDAFLENIPTLLSSETKSIVNSTLMILDKLAKKRKGLQEQICISICGALLHNDESIQVRAAKLITKYGDENSEVLKTEISIYQEGLLSSTKDLLSAYMEASEVEEEVEAFVPQEIAPRLIPSNEIHFPENFDDLVYLMSQAVEGGMVYQKELAVAALIRYHLIISVEDADKLSPVFQRAYKIVKNGQHQGRIGYVDHMFAVFLCEYANILIEKFSDASKVSSIRAAFEKEVKKEAEERHWFEIPNMKLAKWENYNKDEVYLPFKYFFIEVLDKLKKEESTSFLSTPSHAPYWINPAIYVDRLEEYQSKGISPHVVDWQIAISRLAFENTTEAVQLAKQKLEGEYLEMTLFLFEDNYIPKGKLNFNKEWIVAALTKNPYQRFDFLEKIAPTSVAQRAMIGEWDFKMERTERKEKDYDYTTHSYNETDKIVVDKYLIVKNNMLSFYEVLSGNRLFRKLKNALPTNNKKYFFLYNTLRLRAEWFGLEINDIEYLASLVPNNYQPLLAYLCKGSFKNAIFWGEDVKKMVIKVGQHLLENWRGGGKMAHLFVCATLTSSDKTARAIGAEIWIKGVNENSIDSKLMGQILGKMQSIDFIPLKRLTDIMQDFILKISTQHNQALETAITQMIPLLPVDPIKNTKKLLEVYKEILSQNKSKIEDDKVLDRLENWTRVKSLQKIIKQIT